MDTANARPAASAQIEPPRQLRATVYSTTETASRTEKSSNSIFRPRKTVASRALLKRHFGAFFN